MAVVAGTVLEVAVEVPTVVSRQMAFLVHYPLLAVQFLTASRRGISTYHMGKDTCS